MSTETTSTTTTMTATTMRVAVTSSPFTGRRDHNFHPAQAIEPRPKDAVTRTSPPQAIPKQPSRGTRSSGQHRPQLRHRIAHRRPRHQVIHLPHPRSIQKRLSHPDHRHLNRIHPPPPEHGSHLTLQPRCPRPTRHHRFPTTRAPPVLHHPKLRMHRRPTHLQINRFLRGPFNPEVGLEVRQPPHPGFYPNLPTRKLDPPHCLEDVRHCETWLSCRLRKRHALKSSGLSGAIKEVDRREGKEATEVRTGGSRTYTLSSCLPICRAGDLVR